MAGPRLPEGLALRPAVPADAALISGQRAAMFRDMGTAYGPDAETAFVPWVRERLAGGTYLGWIVERGGEPVAGAGLMLIDWPPHAADPHPRRAYLLNVYVRPDARGLGLARALSGAAIEATRARGIRVLSLHASEAGRPVYEKLGFLPTNEMRLLVEQETGVTA